MLPITTLVDQDARQSEALIALCQQLFDDFTPEYLLDRLAVIDRPALTAAHFPDGRLAGFKLGYRRGQELFYSWLGGVHPDARRQGLARALMEAQHAWAAAAGYMQVETRTRTDNRAMIILNLQCGFEVCAFEVDRNGFAVVTQRRVL